MSDFLQFFNKQTYLMAKARWSQEYQKAVEKIRAAKRAVRVRDREYAGAKPYGPEWISLVSAHIALSAARKEMLALLEIRAEMKAKACSQRK